MKRTTKRKRSQPRSAGKSSYVRRLNPALVQRELPLIKYMSKMKGSPAKKAAMIRAAGPNFQRAVCSICKNIEVGNVRLPRRPTKREATTIRRLARGGQRGGGWGSALSNVIPLVTSTIPSVIDTITNLISGKKK